MTLLRSPIRSAIKQPVGSPITFRASGFSPVDLGPKLLAWWDASYGITVTGAGVSAWVDRKRGYSVVQATDASRPAYSATGFNGAPGLTFDGTDDRLSMPSQPFPQGDSNTEVWVVAENSALAATAGNKVVFSFGAPSPMDARMARFTLNVIRTVAAGTAIPPASVAVSARFVARSVFKTSELSITADGGIPVTAAVTPTVGSSTVRIGANSESTAGAFWHGKVRDVIVTGLLTTAQAADMHAFLLARRML